MDCASTGSAVDISKLSSVYLIASQNPKPPISGHVVIEETEAA
jgi:hypothetical protein